MTRSHLIIIAGVMVIMAPFFFRLEGEVSGIHYEGVGEQTSVAQPSSSLDISGACISCDHRDGATSKIPSYTGGPSELDLERGKDPAHNFHIDPDGPSRHAFPLDVVHDTDSPHWPDDPHGPSLSARRLEQPIDTDPGNWPDDPEGPSSASNKLAEPVDTHDPSWFDEDDMMASSAKNKLAVPEDTYSQVNDTNIEDAYSRTRRPPADD